MKIRAINPIGAGHRHIKPGELAYLPDADAQALIDCGTAELVLPISAQAIRIRVLDALRAEGPTVASIPLLTPRA